MNPLTIARSELVTGGQKSGKTARAEQLAAAWLAASASHRALYVATAEAADSEMRERIARHRRERAQRVPAMPTLEASLQVAEAIASHSTPRTLIVVDCLTLWLTGRMFPQPPATPLSPAAIEGLQADLVAAIAAAPGPVVVVGNEIGLGVIPMGTGVRAFVDALGLLNQRVAAACDRVTLMVAGLPLTLKETT